MKTPKHFLIAPVAWLLIGCASSNVPPSEQLAQQTPLNAQELQQIFIGNSFTAVVTNGRFGGRYKVDIQHNNQVRIDDGRHYRSWQLQGNKVCIESCFHVYPSLQDNNVYYASASNGVGLIIKPLL